MDWRERFSGKPGQWWLWPLMPIAAVLGAYVGSALCLLVIGILQGGYRDDGWMYVYPRPLMASAAFGWIYTTIACAAAPNGKFTAGVVMATLLGATMVVIVAVSWTLQEISATEATKATVNAVGRVLGCIVGIQEFQARIRRSNGVSRSAA